MPKIFSFDIPDFSLGKLYAFEPMHHTWGNNSVTPYFQGENHIPKSWTKYLGPQVQRDDRITPEVMDLVGPFILIDYTVVQMPAHWNPDKEIVTVEFICILKCDKVHVLDARDFKMNGMAKVIVVET